MPLKPPDYDAEENGFVEVTDYEEALALANNGMLYIQFIDIVGNMFPPTPFTRPCPLSLFWDEAVHNRNLGYMHDRFYVKLEQ